MNYLWQITLDDYIEICERAKANGKKAGGSMQEEFLEYVKEKNIKKLGATELTKEELIKEYESYGKKILRINTDKKDIIES